MNSRTKQTSRVAPSKQGARAGIGQKTSPSALAFQPFKAQHLVWASRDMSPAEKLVALALLSNTSSRTVDGFIAGEVTMKVAAISAATGYESRAIRRSLKSVEEKGVIGCRKNQRASTYWWIPESLYTAVTPLRAVGPADKSGAGTEKSYTRDLPAAVAATWNVLVREFSAARGRSRWYQGSPNYRDDSLTDEQRSTLVADVERLADLWCAEGEDRESVIGRVSVAFWGAWLERTGTAGQDGKPYLVKRRHDPVELFHPRWRDRECIVEELAAQAARRRRPRPSTDAPPNSERRPAALQTREGAAAIAELLKRAPRLAAGGMR